MILFGQPHCVFFETIFLKRKKDILIVLSGFCCVQPTSQFTCGIAAIKKRGKTNGISLSNAYTPKHIMVKMLRSCCVKNCSNNAKSRPHLNFFILLSDKQQVVVGCKQLVGLRLMKMKNLSTRLDLPKHDIVKFVLNIL